MLKIINISFSSVSWFFKSTFIRIIFFLLLILQILLKQRKIKEKVQVYQVCRHNFYPNTIIYHFKKNNKLNIHVYVCFKNDANQLCIYVTFT